LRRLDDAGAIGHRATKGSQAMPTAREYNQMRRGTWVGDLGIEITSVEPGCLRAQVQVRKELLSPNGFLHAAAVIALADSLCGSGAMENLPHGARGYTTIELKANLLGTARHGRIECEARLVHGGRSTQVWDAGVRALESGKTIALFRCTQMILYPQAK
jgi:uncharacterized protein (TIGR00369 family)